MKYEHIKEKKQADLNLYYCGEDRNLEPGVRYGPVIRDAFIIECCTNGYGSVIINGTEFPIRPKDCIILLPGDTIIHTADFKKPREGFWCSFGGMKVGSYLKAIGISSSQPYVPAEVFDSIVGYMQKIHEIQDDTDAGAELRRNGYLHLVLSEIMRCAKKATDSTNYVQSAITIMEMQYSEPLSVEVIASELGLERCYFSTLFKKATGKAPHEYLSELRIKKACILLESDRLSINEVSSAVGIEPVNFSRVFKKYVGKLPREYKKTV